MKNIISLLFLVWFSSLASSFNKTDSISKPTERRWEVYAGGVVNYMIPSKTFAETHPSRFTLRPGCGMLLSYYIARRSKISTGIFFNSLNSSYKDTVPNGLGGYWQWSISQQTLGVPLYYTLMFFSHKKMYPSVQSGFLFNWLASNSWKTCYQTNDCSSQEIFINKSFAISFLISVDFNFKITDRIILNFGFEYNHPFREFMFKPAWFWPKSDILVSSLGLSIQF